MENKITIITGSTSGIGKQIGIDLLNKGHFVIFNGSSEKSCCDLGIELTHLKYDNYKIIKANLSNVEHVTSFIKCISDKNIDNIIFNLGITDRTKFGDIKFDEWGKVFNVNLNYPFFMLQILKNYINCNGKIIFIGSISGHLPDATSISYGVSKGALEILTKYLAKEFAIEHITVNCIAPGYTMTKWHQDKSPEQLERIKNKTLLKRFATTEEISKVCQMLLENDYITGQTISVDGGIGL